MYKIHCIPTILGTPVLVMPILPLLTAMTWATRRVARLATTPGPNWRPPEFKSMTLFLPGPTDSNGVTHCFCRWVERGQGIYFTGTAGEMGSAEMYSCNQQSLQGILITKQNMWTSTKGNGGRCWGSAQNLSPLGDRSVSQSHHLLFASTRSHFCHLVLAHTL